MLVAGVPTVVAKRMMPQALVGRVVGDEGAAAAAAADGASLVLVEVRQEPYGCKQGGEGGWCTLHRGRRVSGATCTDGAYPMQGAGGAVPAASMLTGAKTGQRSGNAIPVLMSVRAASGAAGEAAGEALAAADVDGVATSVEALPAVARACFDLAEVGVVVRGDGRVCGA